MGDFASHKFIRLTTWALAALVIAVNFYLVITFISDPDSPTPQTAGSSQCALSIGVAYVSSMWLLATSKLSTESKDSATSESKKPLLDAVEEAATI